MADQWHVAISGRQHGPFTLAQILNGLREGKITLETLVWKEGMSEWMPAKDLTEFRGVDKPLSSPPSIPKQANIDHETTSARKAESVAPQTPKLDHEITRMGARASKPATKGKAIDFEMTTIGATHVKTESTATKNDRSQGNPNPSPKPVSSWQLPIGTRLGKYIVGPVLGKGGMGVAYRVTDSETEMDYAIKVLIPELVIDPKAVSDLKREVALAKQISHTNLLKVNEFVQFENPNQIQGTLEKFAFIEMEYVDGENLEEYRIKKGGKISEQDFMAIAPQILSGLNHLHEKGLVHSDIKPQNIMISKEGVIKVADYGVAKSVREQLAKKEVNEIQQGSLAYMSPEQLKNDICDRRSDIYSLGMTFYKLLVGDFPFKLNKKEIIVKWHLDTKHELVLDGKVNPELIAFLDKSMKSNPAHRYKSCEEMLSDLKNIFSTDLEVNNQEIKDDLAKFISLCSVISQLLANDSIDTRIIKLDTEYRLLQREDIFNKKSIAVDTIAELFGFLIKNPSLQNSKSAIDAIKRIQKHVYNIKENLNYDPNYYYLIMIATLIFAFLELIVGLIITTTLKVDPFLPIGLFLLLLIFIPMEALLMVIKSQKAKILSKIDDFCFDFLKRK